MADSLVHPAPAPAYRVGAAEMSDCRHARVIEVGYRVEKDRQPDGSIHRRCYAIARCRTCGAKLLQLYSMRRQGVWVESPDDPAVDQHRETA